MLQMRDRLQAVGGGAARRRRSGALRTVRRGVQRAGAPCGGSSRVSTPGESRSGSRSARRQHSEMEARADEIRSCRHEATGEAGFVRREDFASARCRIRTLCRLDRGVQSRTAARRLRRRHCRTIASLESRCPRREFDRTRAQGEAATAFRQRSRKRQASLRARSHSAAGRPRRARSRREGARHRRRPRIAPPTAPPHPTYRRRARTRRRSPRTRAPIEPLRAAEAIGRRAPRCMLAGNRRRRRTCGATCCPDAHARTSSEHGRCRPPHASHSMARRGRRAGARCSLHRWSTQIAHGWPRTGPARSAASVRHHRRSACRRPRIFPPISCASGASPAIRTPTAPCGCAPAS